MKTMMIVIIFEWRHHRQGASNSASSKRLRCYFYCSVYRPFNNVLWRRFCITISTKIRYCSATVEIKRIGGVVAIASQRLHTKQVATLVSFLVSSVQVSTQHGSKSNPQIIKWNWAITCNMLELGYVYKLIKLLCEVNGNFYDVLTLLNQ